MIDKIVCKLTCPSDCIDHNEEYFQVSYNIPIVGEVIGSGISEKEADEDARLIMWETVSKFYILKSKEMMELEKIVDEVRGYT